MNYTDLPGLDIAVTDGVATVEINHPPLNLLDGVLLPSLRRFVNQVRVDPDVRVIVFSSVDPEFFIAHGDMRFITDPEVLAAAAAAVVAAAPDRLIPANLNLMQAVHEEVRALPQITIGKITGLARGGGNEFLMALDMRFAAIGMSGQAQPETLLGIIPGGGGSQYMTRLIGRARALELILGGQLVGAQQAEKYGLVNRALPADKIDGFVDSLARRIAALRPEIRVAAVAAIDAGGESMTLRALSIENEVAMQLFTPEAAELARKQLAAGVQTREGERELESILNRHLTDRPRPRPITSRT
jgi:enoyl-CoA hydratase/carnithine racemase